jgi:hypothetical protein
LLIAVNDESQLSSELALWADLGNEHLRLSIGQDNFAGGVLTCRPEDRCLGAVHWVQFKLDELGRRQLAEVVNSERRIGRYGTHAARTGRR